MHFIEEAFGKSCDLYADVLSCQKTADKAQLRKAYYRSALKYHPDKNPDDDKASKMFQAVSLAYQILQDPDLRAEYDETGVIPNDTADDDKDFNNAGAAEWKKYFDQIFGKVTTSDIDAFASKYKCSDEEKRDVLKEFKKRKGNLVKMMEFVMLSEPRDATRWVEDYIRPAMENGEADSKFKGNMEKTLKVLQKKAEKEDAEEEASVDDDEKTESEDEEDAKPTPKKQKTGFNKSSPKGKPARGKKGNDISDLVSQIRNKNKVGNVFADLGARYGVQMDDEDPLNDAEFAKIQEKLNKKRRK